MRFFPKCNREAITYDPFLIFLKNGCEIETAETEEKFYFLCDKRRRVAVAFWLSLVWAAFGF
jgi:hypothetical protein